MFEVPEQGSGGLVGVATLGGNLLGGVLMGVPAPVVELDEPNATLGESTGQQSVVRVLADPGGL